MGPHARPNFRRSYTEPGVGPHRPSCGQPTARRQSGAFGSDPSALSEGRAHRAQLPLAVPPRGLRAGNGPARHSRGVRWQPAGGSRAAAAPRAPRQERKSGGEVSLARNGSRCALRLLVCLRNVTVKARGAPLEASARPSLLPSQLLWVLGSFLLEMGEKKLPARSERRAHPERRRVGGGARKFPSRCSASVLNLPPHGRRGTTPSCPWQRKDTNTNVFFFLKNIPVQGRLGAC